MSLKDIRSECSDVAGLLQPYIDAELSDQEQLQIADHLEECSGCRAAVSEQAWVRSTLQTLEREHAPATLRPQILAALDDIDREQPPQRTPLGFGQRLWIRFRDLGRGSLIMAPAGAVAIGVFLLAREGMLTPPSPADPDITAGLGSALLPAAEVGLPPEDLDVMRALTELEPHVGFSVQVAPHDAERRGLQLVGASIDRDIAPGRTPAARLRYQLPGGQHLVDRQIPADAFSPRGKLVSHGGRSYHVHRDDQGHPVVLFLADGVAHTLMLEGSAAPSPRGVPGLIESEDLLLKFAARWDP